MSARTKVRGNRALRCDVPGCESVTVADWWGTDAGTLRYQARRAGWSRCLAPLTARGWATWVDVCPEHEHAPGCACPKPSRLN